MSIALHMSAARLEVAGSIAQTLTRQAESTVTRCALLIERLLGQRQHPQQAFYGYQGVLPLGLEFDIAGLEVACARAPSTERCTRGKYWPVSSILWKPRHAIVHHFYCEFSDFHRANVPPPIALSRLDFFSALCEEPPDF